MTRSLLCGDRTGLSEPGPLGMGLDAIQHLIETRLLGLSAR